MKDEQLTVNQGLMSLPPDSDVRTFFWAPSNTKVTYSKTKGWLLQYQQRKLSYRAKMKCMAKWSFKLCIFTFCWYYRVWRLIIITDYQIHVMVENARIQSWHSECYLANGIICLQALATTVGYETQQPIKLVLIKNNSAGNIKVLTGEISANLYSSQFRYNVGGKPSGQLHIKRQSISRWKSLVILINC